MTASIKAIRTLLFWQTALIILWLYSFEFFINTEIAFLSAFFVMMGSMYSYWRMVRKRATDHEAYSDEEMIDKIDDPYDLYSEDVEPLSSEEVDIKAVVKAEKARLKGHTTKSTAASAPAMLSLYRIGPYLLLVLGFIGLKNNELLALWPYMIGLSIGIIAGYMSGKVLFTSGP